MLHRRLDDMTRGWFIGAFEPTILKTSACEVAIRHYQAGDREAAHYHRIAHEVTAVVSGRIRMFGAGWSAGDIIAIEPNETTAFEALTEAITVVVKTPSAPDDKYFL